MKKRYIATSLVITLLSSCSTVQLRSDIENFITPFSLSRAQVEYVSGGFTSTKIRTDSEGENRDIITFDFDLTDRNNPAYKKVSSKYVGEELSSQTIEQIENDSGIWYLKVNEDRMEYSLNKCLDLITKFFYTTSKLEDTYHEGGMYYGDLIRHIITDLQNCCTIDEENGLLKMDYTQSFTEQGESGTITSRYSVDTFGMLVNYHQELTTSTVSIVQDIEVFKGQRA